VWTLVTKNMELHLSSLLAVVTYNANLHVLVLSGHRRLRDLSVHFSPEIFVLIQRDVANWATQGLQPCTRHLEFAQAVLVYGMTALQDGDLDGRLKEILNADGTILVHGVLHAGVGVPNLVGITASTGVAVEVILAAANTTDTALLAMKNLLLHSLVVPKVAVGTEVGP